MSDAISSQGVQLWFYKHEETPEALPNSLPAVNATGWKMLAEIIDLSNDGPMATMIDTKHLGSPAGFKEFARGFKDGGTLQVSANYIDVQFARGLYLFKDFYRQTSGATCYRTDVRWWEIRIPDESCGGLQNRISSWGLLETLGLDVPEDDRVTTSIRVKLTSYPVFTAAAGNTLLDQAGSVQTPVPGHVA